MDDSTQPTNPVSDQSIDISATLVNLTINNHALLNTIVDLLAEIRRSSTEKTPWQIDNHISDLLARNLELARNLVVHFPSKKKAEDTKNELSGQSASE